MIKYSEIEVRFFKLEYFNIKDGGIAGNGEESAYH